MATFSKDDLNAMTRPQLQRLCKDYNIKANLRTDQIVDLLSKQTIQSDELPRPSSQAGVSELARSRSLRKSFSQPSLMQLPKYTSNSASATAASTVSTHSRTASRDATKPITRTIPDRKPPPPSTLARSSSRAGNTGKENGLISTNVAKSALPEPKAVSHSLAASTSVPSKTIAGRMAALALGRGPAKLTDRNTNTGASTSSTRIAVSASTAAKPSAASIAFDAAIETRCKEVEQASEKRWNEVASLIEALTDRMIRAEEAAETMRLALQSRYAEIDTLRTDVSEAQAEAARQTAITESLVQTMDQQTKRVEELESVLQTTTDNLAALTARFNDVTTTRKDEQADIESRIQGLEIKFNDLSKSLSSSKSTSHFQTPSVGSRIKSQHSQTFSNVTNSGNLEKMNWSPHCLSNTSNPYLDLEYNRLAAELDLTATPAGRRSRIARSLTTPLGSGMGELGFVMGDNVMAQYNGFSRHGEDSPSFMTFEGTNRAYL